PQAEAGHDAARPAEFGYRSCSQLHGWGSLARYRGRQTGRLSYDLDRRRLWRGVSVHADRQGRLLAERGFMDNRSEQVGADFVKKLSELKVAIFADGAEKAGMLEMYAKPYIRGFTTNPTLMQKAGVADYESFARDILQAIPDRPISFEVFADEFTEMER